MHTKRPEKVGAKQVVCEMTCTHSYYHYQYHWIL